MKSGDLLAAARAQTGLDDFGDLGFTEPLDAFLESVLVEGGLGEPGIVGLQQDLVRHLANRLLLQKALTGTPSIRDEQLDDPIVIVGLPRTGTTKLQRMIAQDPGVQSLPLWKAMFPAPLGEPDQRLEMTTGFVELMAQQAPDFVAAHPMSPTEADEEMFIQLGAFDGPAAWGNFYHAPSYVDWLRGRSATDSYAYLRTMLQYVQWQDGGRRGRPWVLKTPLHLAHLDTLTATFPRAVVVHCHRDLEVGVASLCRLIEVARLARGCEEVDPHEIGAYMLTLWAHEWSANLAQRSSVPSTATVLDVQFDAIVADPIEVIRQVYATGGRALDPSVARAMRQWEQEHPPAAGRRYTLADYGISADDIRGAFAPYLQTMGAGA